MQVSAVQVSAVHHSTTQDCSAQRHTLGSLRCRLQVLAAVTANPKNFYVNVHTVPNYGAGAVRGQLFDWNEIDPTRLLPGS